jgi:hypothetical protein
MLAVLGDGGGRWALAGVTCAHQGYQRSSGTSSVTSSTAAF